MKVYIVFCFTFFQFYSMISWDNKVHNFASFLFLLLIIMRSCRLAEVMFVGQNPRGDCVRHFPGQMLGCAYTICSYGQIKISCTIPRGSPCLPSRVKSYTLSVLICCTRLLCDWLFRLSHHITNVCHINSYFDMIGSYGVALCCYWKRFSFSFKVSFFSHPYLCIK